ncbi:hypothetical protein [Thermus scotoductus]|jgi:hypothetical protein|uniref:Uncharacterized protein n=1 Tax=Thermus scotoductus TaxID=37636 RepID=A0A430QWB3_THESC|nr:hypothetical protein [Thermus scotoductus]RTG96717.1 hypothetical protein CSW51_04560 [Thermus scotoductus]RTG99352.1 hypothetical protein CSW47_16160 [Thermus scotoductus]RTH03862.1 hypothetical protein CSW50_04055 [Thermus scotoductus]RTH21410.1 hypothetical protein CSW40_13195 [Thermus scotoductus]RTH24092.1 hypothetical protein CSW38_09660 [Thermus scotoductus]
MELGQALEAAVWDGLEKPAQSKRRWDLLADYCMARLEARGLRGLLGGSRGEVSVRGFARAKDWDVVLLAPLLAGGGGGRIQHPGEKPRLLLSLKSVLRNPLGSLPNRLDDLLGEVSSVQMLYPEVVIGYVVVLDHGAFGKSAGGKAAKAGGEEWEEGYNRFKERLAHLTQRRPPLWAQGLIEGHWVIEVDSRTPGLFLDLEATLEAGEAFFDALVGALREREPLLFLDHGQKSL